VGAVRTAMIDGGSIERQRLDGSVTVGPDSVGYEITSKGMDGVQSSLQFSKGIEKSLGLR
jgi:hypothetical protein